MLKSGTQSMYWGRKYAKMDERRMPKTISTVLPTLRGIVPIEGGRGLSSFSTAVTGTAVCRCKVGGQPSRGKFFSGDCGHVRRDS
jgi:hypothetical protein